MHDLQSILETSAGSHSHLCPRQVLGVRMGLAAASILGIEVPRSDKRLLVIVETDGCFVSGIQAVSGCEAKHRTLRVEDYGKVAATFADVQSARAIRLAPRIDVRQRALLYAPRGVCRYQAQLLGYQVMPVDELLAVQEVTLTPGLEYLISRAGQRTLCDRCGEEIINSREIHEGSQTLCRGCLGTAYYQVAAPGVPIIMKRWNETWVEIAG